jgi:putative ABC transport system permease protein
MLFRRRRNEDEFSDELQSHLEMHIADNVRAGMTPDEARRHALIALGGMEQAKERCREQRRWQPLESFGRDMLVGFRSLVRDRGFTITAALVLGIGLALTNTFFILAHSIVFRGVPIDDPDRVLMLRARDTADRNLGMSYPDYLDIRGSAQSFSQIGAFTWAPMTLGDASHSAERFTGEYVSANMFSLIGERPIAGRDFQPEDDRPGAPPVVILGRSIWESRYGGSTALIDSTLRVNGVEATVIGIVPDRSKTPSNAVVWQPLGALPGIAEQSRGSRQLDVFGRLKPDVSATDAIGELQGIWSELVRRYPSTNTNIRLRPIPVNHNYVGESIHPAWFAFIAAGFLVLAVACANVANLLVMRGAHRAGEIAVRTSLGATRARIVRQLLAESVVLAIVGGAIGLLLSMLGAHILWMSTPEGMLPHWMRFTMDPPVFAVLAAVCLGSAVVFGLAPAFQISRGGLIASMSGGSRGIGRGMPSRRLTSALLVAQFAVSLGALVSISATARDVSDDYGVGQTDIKGVLTMSIALPIDRYGTPESRIDFYDRLRRRFESVTGVTQAAFASNLPLGGAASRGLILEGQDINSKGPRPTVRSVSISPEYFDTLRVPLLRGRRFTDQDGTGDPTAVIVNQRLADLYFANTDPIGKTLTLVIDSAPRRFTIVGVSRTIKQRTGIGPDPDPVVYFPHRATAPAQMSMIVRGVTTPASIAESLRTAMRSLDADIPLYRMMTLQQAVEEADWNTHFSNVVATAAGLLAVLLSAVGLFALTGHAVATMTPEIGIRTALGARPRQVLDRVLRRAAVQLVLGIAAGIAFALAWSRIFGVASAPKNTGLLDFAVAAVALAIVSVLACIVPAVRALRVSPIVALRYD